MTAFFGMKSSARLDNSVDDVSSLDSIFSTNYFSIRSYSADFLSNPCFRTALKVIYMQILPN